MPYFRYRAINDNGKVITGMVESSNKIVVMEIIKTLGLYPVTIKKIKNYWIAKIIKWLIYGKVKRKDIIEFSNNLSVMLNAGIPLLSSLEDIASTTENRYFKEKILSIVSMIQMGSTFSDAISLHKDIFPEIFIKLVTVGEETGRLAQSLKDISKHLQRMETLISAVKRALLYPIFSILIITVVLIFWLVYVLPKIEKLFKEMGIPLPLLTRIVMGISRFTKDYWYFILGFILICYVMFVIIKKNKTVKLKIDRIKFSIPIVKLIVHNKVLAIFSEQMEILLTAGIGIDRAFELSAPVTDNYYVMKIIKQVKEEIIAGSSITDALRIHWIFPPMFIRMVYIGEQTGRLTEQFIFLAEHFIEKLEDIIHKIGKMLEPIIILIIGLLFIIFILSILLPIYDLVVKIGVI